MSFLHTVTVLTFLELSANAIHNVKPVLFSTLTCVLPARLNQPFLLANVSAVLIKIVFIVTEIFNIAQAVLMDLLL